MSSLKVSDLERFKALKAEVEKIRESILQYQLQQEVLLKKLEELKAEIFQQLKVTTMEEASERLVLLEDRLQQKFNELERALNEYRALLINLEVTKLKAGGD